MHIPNCHQIQSILPFNRCTSVFVLLGWCAEYDGVDEAEEKKEETEPEDGTTTTLRLTDTVRFSGDERCLGAAAEAVVWEDGMAGNDTVKILDPD